jgi:predicted nucleic acid-binding protein
MKVVVADTSPLNYLVLIQEIDALAQLYGEVLVPEIVIAELKDSDAPLAVAQWASHLPFWIDVRPTPPSDQRLERLDEGERAAILLAESQSSPVLLLIDDADGRAEAERRNIAATGTLGVLRAAGLRGLINLPTALTRLRATNFRCPAGILDELIAEDAQRKGAKSQT